MRNKVGCLKFVLSLLVCTMALCICISPALAQSSSTGALAGVVSDPSGAVIVGATVTATNLGTGAARTTTTNATGAYLISLLPPGDYSVKFEAPGFESSEVPSVTVNVTETPVLNHSMAVGSQTQQVTVESTAESIQTENATVGGLVSGHDVVALPLSTRNYTQIVDLSPGVATNVASATNFGIGTQDVNVNGSSSEHNNYQMEGASIVNYISGKAGQENTYGSIPVPSPDAIQEFKVQTSQFDASYGRNSGGNVNVVLKSGTNNFHGDLWEFNRNNFFNANDFFNKITETNTKQPNSPQTLKQNTFGGTLGGPIKKDKLFFFFEYQGLRQVNGVVNQGYSPGVNLPNINDYADVANGTCANVRCTTGPNPVTAAAAYRTFLGSLYGVGGPEASGNTIAGNGPPIAANGSNVNPVSINWLQATSPLGGYNQGFFVAGAPRVATGTPGSIVDPGTGISVCVPCQLNIEDPADASENQYLINTDYHISDKNTFSERYMYSYLPETIPFGSTMPGSPNAQDFRTDFAVLRLTSILNDNTVNEARVSFNRITTHLADLWNVQSCAIGVIPDVANAPTSATSCSSPGVSIPGGANPDLLLLPTLTISGTAETGTYPVGLFSIGGAGQTSSDVATNQYQAGEQLSYNHGKHSIRVGGDYERAQVNWLLPATERGSVTFRTFQDFLYGTTNTAVTASALSAVGGSHSVPSTGPFYAVRGNTIDAYVQDDIKIKSNLTINIGTRWEYDGLPLGTNTGYLTGDWPVLLNQVNTGSFFNTNPQGTLNGYVMQSKYPLSPITQYGPSFGLVSPTGATGVYINSNNSIIPNSAPKDVFSPRWGFAWQPKKINGLVVRGGYGWFHDRPLASIETKSVAGASPRTVPLNATSISSRSINNPFPPSFQGTTCVTDLSPTGGCPLLGFVPRTLAAPTTIAGIQATYQQPLVQEYNLGIQYAIKGGWVASVGYVGSHGTHLLTSGVNQNPDYMIAGALNTPSGIFGEIPQGSLPYNDVLNVASVSCPACGPVTTNNGPGASAVSTNQIDRARYLGLNPITGFSWTGTDGDSLYDSLQASVQHQFSHGFTLNVAYTWSKLITDISGGLATTGAAQNENGNLIEGGHNSNYSLNTAQQYGLATYNRPQRMVISYNYQLPFKTENGVMNKIVSGWAINGVTTIQDGLPLILTDPAGGTIYGAVKTAGTSRAELSDPVQCNSFGQCYSGLAIQTPGRIEGRYNCYFEAVTSHCGTGLAGGGNLPVVAAIAASGSEPMIGGTQNTVAGPYAPAVTIDGITSGCYASTALPAQYVNCGSYYGNSRMSIARSPSQFNFDMAVSKQIPVTEGTHLEFRAEAFNVFNHTQFNTPASLAVNSSSFGVITSASVPPRIFQFGLKYVF